MSTTGRICTLIALTVAVVTGSVTVPAWASFSETVAVPAGGGRAVSITTFEVDAPGKPVLAQTCSSSYDPATGVTTELYSVTVSWKASKTPTASNTTRGVTGYRILAHLPDGSSYVMAETTAGDLSESRTVDRGYLSYSPTLSVVTLTNSTWTAESRESPVLSCP
jgi:hypothetical protein